MTKQHDSRFTVGAQVLGKYVLRSALGWGGFGQVWLADGPGGRQRAIKISAAIQDDQALQAELNLLERLRSCRHPGLLCPEEIEIVEGHLVTVSQLADGSLEAQLRRVRQRGRRGMDRSRLLDCLRQTADALDVLHHQLGIQHLDLKPANLLLVGDRVLLADFGLTREPGANSQPRRGAFGRLTPRYAAPELFDGNPSHSTDQYSLAVVYQELLTGELPFDGRTFAQLATQHRHADPRLDPLPASDRHVILRALEKDPQRRYASCRELVDELVAAADASAAGSIQTEPATAALPLEDAEARIQALDISTGPTPGVHQRGPLVIAIGQLGAQCARMLQRCDPGGASQRESPFAALTIESPGVAVSVTDCEPSEPEPARATQQTEDRIREFLHQRTQGPSSSAANVYVVAGLDEPTAGRILWHTVFLARQILIELGRPDAQVVPVLGMPEDWDVTQLAHRRPAALLEMDRLYRPGRSDPLRQTILIGASRSTGTGPATSEAIASFLWADAPQPLGSLRSRFRDCDYSTTSEHQGYFTAVRVGTVSPVRVERAADPEPHDGRSALLAMHLRCLAVRGLMGKAGELTQPIDQWAEQTAQQVGLDLPALTDAAWYPLPANEADRWHWLCKLVEAHRGRLMEPRGISRRASASPDPMDQILSALPSPSERDGTGELRLEEDSDAAAMQRLVDAVSDQLAAADVALESAIAGVEHLTEFLSAAAMRLQLSAPRRTTEADQMQQALRSHRSRDSIHELIGNADEPGPVPRYLHLRLQANVDQRLAARLQRLPALLNQVKQRLEAWRDLLGTGLATEAKVSGSRSGLPEAMRRSLAAAKPRFFQATAGIRQQLVTQLREHAPEAGGNSHPPAQDSSQSLMRSVAEQSERHAISLLNSDGEATETVGNQSSGELDQAAASRGIVAELNQLAGQVAGGAGDSRVLLVAGDSAQAAGYRNAWSSLGRGPAEVVVVADSRPLVIGELTRIPFETLGATPVHPAQTERPGVALTDDPTLLGFTSVR